VCNKVNNMTVSRRRTLLGCAGYVSYQLCTCHSTV
jgi:hypothetical protein